MTRLFVVIIGLFLLVFLLPGRVLAAEENRKEGRAFYLKHCKICHGPEGKGDGYTHFNPPVADLTVSRIQKIRERTLGKYPHGCAEYGDMNVEVCAGG